jgi:hypothetical protein
MISRNIKLEDTQMRAQELSSLDYGKELAAEMVVRFREAGPETASSVLGEALANLARAGTDEQIMGFASVLARVIRR